MPTAGLIGRWGLNEGTGTPPGRQRRRGTLPGRRSRTSTWVAGARAQYATLGGVGQLRAPSFTLELWFKRTGAGVGTSTGTGGVANAIPLITKGRAEGETAAADINYLFGIDANTGRLVADFEEAQSRRPVPASTTRSPERASSPPIASGTTPRRPMTAPPGSYI